ncbi:hypothetical protein OIU77_017348 [Salix suchowensis]|uniref:Uncharacterized protein n=1 Tax=Salix suchowensis TaxID=1278906 RepID=A0ABQ8ZNK6_9ROSI|nr:hypothetical protein OIU77_017348 [Salix suchowensis]
MLQSSTRLAPRRSHHHSPSPELNNYMKKYLEDVGTAFIGFHRSWLHDREQFSLDKNISREGSSLRLGTPGLDCLLSLAGQEDFEDGISEIRNWNRDFHVND